MPKFTSSDNNKVYEYATLEETLEFCNKVREVGGGAVLSALVPSIPESPGECLIAKSLNFNCYVNCTDVHGDTWYMAIKDCETATHIMASLDLEPGEWPNGDDEYIIYLPDKIGQVAHAFDETATVLYDVKNEEQDAQWAPREPNFAFIPKSRRELLKQMWPYIEKSIKETYDLGVINDKGELVL